MFHPSSLKGPLECVEISWDRAGLESNAIGPGLGLVWQKWSIGLGPNWNKSLQFGLGWVWASGNIFGRSLVSSFRSTQGSSLHHVFLVWFLWSYIVTDRREGRCCSALLTVGLGILYEFFLACIWSQILLVVRSTLAIDPGSFFPWSLVLSPKWGSRLRRLDGWPLSRKFCLRFSVRIIISHWFKWWTW